MTEKPLQAKIRYTRALGTPYVRGKPVEVGKNLSRYKAMRLLQSAIQCLGRRYIGLRWATF